MPRRRRSESIGRFLEALAKNIPARRSNLFALTFGRCAHVAALNLGASAGGGIYVRRVDL